jgi:hypothetical protein
MCAQWLSIGVLVLKKQTTEFLVICCLNKSFVGLYRFNVLLNKKKPFYSYYPFSWNGCKAYLKSKNTPLLIKELHVINYLCAHLY